MLINKWWHHLTEYPHVLLQKIPAFLVYVQKQLHICIEKHDTQLLMHQEYRLRRISILQACVRPTDICYRLTLPVVVWNLV